MSTSTRFCNHWTPLESHNIRFWAISLVLSRSQVKNYNGEIKPAPIAGGPPIVPLGHSDLFRLRADFIVETHSLVNKHFIHYICATSMICYEEQISPTSWQAYHNSFCWECQLRRWHGRIYSFSKHLPAKEFTFPWSFKLRRARHFHRNARSACHSHAC